MPMSRHGQTNDRDTSERSRRDLGAKKATHSEPRRESGRRLREDVHAYAKDQAKIQSLYVEGYLGHVPASVLSARASPPAQRCINAVWIDLTKQ